MYKHLKFPFENSCIVKIKNNKKIEKVTCELADSIIEIYQSLSFRNLKYFTISLVLKLNDPNTQSIVLSNYN